MEPPLTNLLLASKQCSDRYIEFKRAIVAAVMAEESTSPAAATESAKSEKRSSKNAMHAETAYSAAAITVLYKKEIVVHSPEEMEALKAVLVEFPKPHKLKRVKIHDGVPVEEMREALTAAKFQLLKENTYAIPE